MSNKKETSANGGIGFIGVLTIVFIVLKLLNVIDWSWWWVLSPLWISFGLSILVIVIIVIIAIISVYKEFKSEGEYF